MRRTLEAIFCHPIQLLSLIILLPLLSFVLVHSLPRSYQVTATLWALRRYEIIGATGLESDLSSSPAETQAAALSELLQTRVFALAVAKSTNLASTLNLDSSAQANPSLLDDTLFADISQNVQAQSLGYNLLSVTYAGRDPQVAQQVVTAVIQIFGAQSQGLSTIEGQRLLEIYQTQLAKAKQDADTAAVAEARYVAAHPELAQQLLHTNLPLNDPQYTQLHAQTQQAQAAVQNIQTTIAGLERDIGLQGQNADNLFTMIDAPAKPNQPVSRTRLYLIAVGVGLGVALIACAVYLVILVRRDRAVYTTLDLQKVASLPVVLQLPHLSPKTVPLLVEQSLNRTA